MALETGTYISDLVATNPAAPDGLNQADDHMRLIKSTIKTTFPNINAAVTTTPANLNNGYIPIGGIILWSGAIGAIPANWHLCDGTTGTPNLRDRFIAGAGSAYAVGATGGGATTTSSDGSHSHGGVTGGHTITTDELPTNPSLIAGGPTLPVAPSGQAPFTPAIPHTHTISADGGHTHTYGPPLYYALAYIMRIT
jgi:hypothetical protein